MRRPRGLDDYYLRAASFCGPRNLLFQSRKLQFAHFETVPLHPPTALEPECFDLLIGISIFTHLRESDQFQWLSELERVAAKGAVLLMTTHGETAACRGRWPDLAYHEWRQKGFKDASSNLDLAEVLADGEYYRNVYHTRQYVERSWSRYFKVIEILPGYIGGLQDLVMMIKA